MAASIAACGTLPGWLAVFRDLKQGADHWGGRAPLAVRGELVEPREGVHGSRRPAVPLGVGHGACGVSDRTGLQLSPQVTDRADRLVPSAASTFVPVEAGNPSSADCFRSRTTLEAHGRWLVGM